MSSQAVREVVVFSLVEGAERAEFVDHAARATRWLSTRPGFVSRELSYDSDQSRWIDLVSWRTSDDAATAAAAAMEAAECGPMFGLIDPSSMLLLHGQPVEVTAGA